MILISLGSALYMSVSMLAAQRAQQPFDITRIAAQVASGIGFLGAGSIIVDRGQVQGLTTAATIWAVAGVGLIVGAGYPWFGLLVTFIVLGVLLLVGIFERKFLDRWLKITTINGKRSQTYPVTPSDQSQEPKP